MLNEKEKGIIKETVPVLQEKGTEITSYFYNRMFNQHPELKICLTKRTNKRISINCISTKCFSKNVNIDNLGNIMPVVKEIAYKHCALEVPPKRL